jgi:hypothetical protein
MNYATAWINGGLWLGELAGVITLGMLSLMLVQIYHTFVTLEFKSIPRQGLIHWRLNQPRTKGLGERGGRANWFQPEKRDFSGQEGS